MKKTIVNAEIVLKDSIIPNGYIVIENGRIAAIGEGKPENVKECGEIIDAEGCYVGPGFVDIHNHGYGKAYVYEDSKSNVEYFLSHGTTTLLAALYNSLSKSEFINAVEAVKESRKDGLVNKVLAGLYMEGPYMNPKFGAMPEENKWRHEISSSDYIEMVDAAGSLAKVWVIAPERPKMDQFLQYAKKVNPSAMISVGHSEATPEQIDKLRHFGIGLHTHCMNATGRIPALPGTRSCGPDEACMMNKDSYAELICDSLGLHVHPDMLNYVLSIKGKERVVLITDSFPSEDPNPEQFSHVTDLCFDMHGGLCGSKLTMDMACRNMIKHTGCSISDVFRMASLNPATVIGMEKEIGSVEIGKKANLVFTDGQINIKKTILEGNII